jgi:hypothetical protein
MITRRGFLKMLGVAATAPTALLAKSEPDGPQLHFEDECEATGYANGEDFEIDFGPAEINAKNPLFNGEPGQWDGLEHLPSETRPKMTVGDVKRLTNKMNLEPGLVNIYALRDTDIVSFKRGNGGYWFISGIYDGEEES